MKPTKTPAGIGATSTPLPTAKPTAQTAPTAKKTGVAELQVQTPIVAGGAAAPTTGTGATGTITALTGAAATEGNPYVAFSDSPDKLGQLLHEEITAAFDFVQTMKHAFTFFGGARIKPDDPFFAEGQEWGEAVALANAASVDPTIVAEAAQSGLFSPRAVADASGVALGVAAGAHGSKKLATALAAIGGLSGPDALATALASIDGDRIDPADAKLLMTLTRTGAGPGMMEAVPMGVVSNASGQIEGMLLRHIAQVGHGAHVTMRCIVDSHVVGVAKPDPAIFEHALAHFDEFERSRIVYVGDSVTMDVRAASAAGLHPVLLDPYDDHAGADFERIASVADLAAELTG